MAVFFSGKPLVDNLLVWRTIFRKLGRFFTHPVILNRHGAAVIAVEAVFVEMDGLVKSLKLNSYKIGHCDEVDALHSINKTQIDSATPTLNLGMVKHFFEIEADGVTFLVSVQGIKPTVRRLKNNP